MFFPGSHPRLGPGKNSLDGACAYRFRQPPARAGRDRRSLARKAQGGAVLWGVCAAVTGCPWRGCLGVGHRRGVSATTCRAHDASDCRRPGRAGRPQPAECRTRPAGALGYRWSFRGTRQRAAAPNRGRHAPDRRRKPGQGRVPGRRPARTEGDPYRQRATRTDSGRPVPTERVGRGEGEWRKREGAGGRAVGLGRRGRG